MNKIVSSSLLPAGIGALIWIVVSVATGSPMAFVIVGAIACGVVIFAVHYTLRRFFAKR